MKSLVWFLNFISAFSASLALLAPVNSHAQALDGATLNNAVFTTINGESPQLGLRHDIGFRVPLSDLSANFIVTKSVAEIFAKMAPLRNRMPSFLHKGFQPIVEDLTRYMMRMQKIAAVSPEKLNGLTNWQLSMKITRLAFCFGTDPKGIAAQIFKESTFDRTRVSATGAVGFTQMTSDAIDEVNDQLGNRGHDGALSQNVPYLYQAIRCYMGGQPFRPMFEAGVINRGDTVKGNTAARSRAKAWLRANVDRDLIYGQITLKVLLGNARNNGATGVKAYQEAFKNYNGEPKGRDAIYSRNVIGTMNTI